MADKVFMSVLPRGWQSGDKRGIPLRVIRSDGVKYSPDVSFNKVKLNDGTQYFHNNSGRNDSFTVTVLLSKWDAVTGVEFTLAEWNKILGEERFTEDNSGSLDKYYDAASLIDVVDVLDYYIRNAIPFYVYTRAVGIDDDCLWLVTEHKNRKQSHDGEYVEWDLTFTKYTPLGNTIFNTSSSRVEAAVDKYNKAKNKKTNKQQLAKCDYKTLVYSKTKKEVRCIKVMQAILYNEGFFKCKKTVKDKKTGKKTTTTDKKNCVKKDIVNGWYNDATREAVKAYQKKHHKDYGLPITGNVGINTWKCLCGKGKEVKAAKDKNKKKDNHTIGKTGKVNSPGKTVHK